MMDPAPLMSSVEFVYQRTRMAILSGEYQPGSVLRLRELARHNGVSTSPVREALRRLEAEGFVESTRHRGARVAPLSLPDMLDVYHVRIVLEVDALRLAIPHLTPADITEARILNTRAHELLALGDPSYHVWHRRFHFLLYDRSQSRWLLRLISSIWDHTNRYRAQMESHFTVDESRREHDRILEAIEQGEVDAAAEALKAHLESSRDRLRAIYVEVEAALPVDRTDHDRV